MFLYNKLRLTVYSTDLYDCNSHSSQDLSKYKSRSTKKKPDSLDVNAGKTLIDTS